MGLQIATPQMTSNTTPSGKVSIDGLYGFGEPTEAYYNFWSTPPLSKSARVSQYLGDDLSQVQLPPHWIEYDFLIKSPVILAYEFYLYNDTLAPIDYEFQGWDGADWITLDSVVGADLAEGWSGQISLASPAAYQKYRMYYTAWDVHATFPDLISLGAIVLWESDGKIEVPKADFAFVPTTAEAIIGDYVQAPTAVFDFIPQDPSYKLKHPDVTVPKAVLDFSPVPPALVVIPNADIPSTIIYRVRLTGAADGLEDVVLPVSSYQARLRNNKPTYLSIIVPDGGTWADAVTDRPNGQIVVQRGARYITGEEQLVEIVRADLEDTQDAGGGRSRTLTLSGHETKDHGTPKELELQNFTYRSQSSSGRRVRADLDLNLRPGDTAIFGSENMVAELITYIVSARSGEMMEVSE